ncbi:MAG TPA: hypothetical protein ENF38_01905, partial [Candidatus Aenigmarchaeota archaeon]|nr:hypothetical protein [Candidatus Aenigmarchaeota archaeon]
MLERIENQLENLSEKIEKFQNEDGSFPWKGEHKTIEKSLDLTARAMIYFSRLERKLVVERAAEYLNSLPLQDLFINEWTKEKNPKTIALVLRAFLSYGKVSQSKLTSLTKELFKLVENG